MHIFYADIKKEILMSISRTVKLHITLVLSSNSAAYGVLHLLIYDTMYI